MKIFILNNWSSSLKYQLIQMPEWNIFCEWLVENIWNENWTLTHKFNWKKIKEKFVFKNHKDSLKEVLNILINWIQWEWSVIKNLNEIEWVWHRVVHWWENFLKSVIIDDKVLKVIEKCEELAPLHNKANKEWILIMQEILPHTLQVAVFDTAFHSSMKKENYLYPIPLKYYEKYKIRRYWFHWTSHKFIYERTCEILNKKDIKIINCHIWNWASICAINSWKVIETSMWFTPLEWLMMWTRSWDIDPSIIPYIMKKENLSSDELNSILSKESWVKWLTWNSDLRELEDNFLEWQKDAIVYMNMYINRIIKYIWSYYLLMWWVDVITLTAWAMENSPLMRELILEKLNILWIKIDKQENNCRGKEKIISDNSSKIKVIIIPTNEEYMIAKETYNFKK